MKLRKRVLFDLRAQRELGMITSQVEVRARMIATEDWCQENSGGAKTSEIADQAIMEAQIEHEKNGCSTSKDAT